MQPQEFTNRKKPKSKAVSGVASIHIQFLMIVLDGG